MLLFTIQFLYYMLMFTIQQFLYYIIIVLKWTSLRTVSIAYGRLGQ